MITFTAPGFLLAGALLAAVPLALHMLARTPPERRPLPTARFLTVDRRTRLRLRRPGDLVLLALRMTFLVLLGAAFARPEWLPERTGGAVVVLLDAGPAMAPVWDEAIAVARDRLGAGGALVVFDSTARVAADPEAALDSLAAAAPRTDPTSYLAALRGLKAAAGTLPAESARAVLITRPRWGAWSPAVATARDAAWSARIEVVALGGPTARADPVREQADGESSGVEPGEAGAAALLGPEDHPLRPFATAALRALGYAPGSDTTAALVVVLPGTDTAPSGPDTVPPRPLPHARGVVLLGGPVGEEPGGAPPRSRGRLVLPGGHAMEGWVPRAGRVTDGSVVVAVWEDGRPAAAASRDGGSCRAYLAAEPVTAAAAADPAFPRLLRAMATACTPPGAPGPPEESVSLDEVALEEVPLDQLPLDRGALAILRGDTLPLAADLLSAEGPRRRSLARLMMTLALLVGLAEAAIAYGRRGAR